MKGLTLGGLALATSLIAQPATPQKSISQMTPAEIHNEFVKICNDPKRLEHILNPEIMCEYSPDGGKTWMLYTGLTIVALVAAILSGVLLVRIYRKKEGTSTPEVPPLFTTQSKRATGIRSAAIPSKLRKASEKATTNSTPVQKIDEAVPLAQIEHTVGDTIEGKMSTEEGDSLTPKIQSFVKVEDEQGFNNFLNDLGVGNNNASGVAETSQGKTPPELPKSEDKITTLIDENNVIEKERIKRLERSCLDEELRIKRSTGKMMDIYVTTNLGKNGITFTNNIQDNTITLSVHKEGSGIYFLVGDTIRLAGFGEEYTITGAKKLNFRQIDKKPCIEIVYSDYSTETIELKGA